MPRDGFNVYYMTCSVAKGNCPEHLKCWLDFITKAYLNFNHDEGTSQEIYHKRFLSFSHLITEKL